MNRRLPAILAILIALPLIAYPAASPPTEPEDRLRLTVHQIGGNVDEAAIDDEIVPYEDLTADERAFFDDAVDRPPNEAAISDAPEWFVTLATDDRTAFVTRDGNYHRTWAYTSDPGPQLVPVVGRLLAIVVAGLLLGAGGYLLVNDEE